MLINTRQVIDQRADQCRGKQKWVNSGQSKTEEGGADVSTGLNDQISQLGGHIYYLMAPSALSLAGTFPSGSLNFPGT